MVTGYTFAFWRQKRLVFFVLLCAVVTLYSLGGLLESLSTTQEGALIGVKVTYLGATFLGMMLYLFSRDYRGRPRLSVWKRVILWAISAAYSLCVFFYPWFPFYYASISFGQSMGVSYLSVEPGLLYFPCFVYIFILTILGVVNLIRHFYEEKKYQGAIMFFIGVLLPTATQIVTTLGIIPPYLKMMTVSLVISSCLMFLFLLRHRMPEWQSTGREVVVENMRDAFILVDYSNNLLDYNKRAKDLFPTLASLHLGEGIGKVDGFPVGGLEEEEPLEFNLNYDDRELSLRMACADTMSEGVKTGTIILIADETERHKMMEELSRLAHRDELTGLLNRATFFHDAIMSFDLIRRQDNPTGCALMIDIDYFKMVNDTYGHAVGDEVLRFIGNTINRRFRRTDICGRYGGEELCVWMPSTDIKGAYQVAEELRKSIEEKVFNVDGVCFSVTISIGVAGMPDLRNADFEELMKQADTALYKAKHEGRNRVCSSDFI